MRTIKLFLITAAFAISAQLAMASPKFIQTSPVINDTNCICSDTECHRDYKRAVTIDSWNTVGDQQSVYTTISPEASGNAAGSTDSIGYILILSAHNSPYLTGDPYCGLYVYTATVGDYRNHYCSPDYPCYATSSNDPCQASKFKKSK